MDRWTRSRWLRCCPSANRQNLGVPCRPVLCPARQASHARHLLGASWRVVLHPLFTVFTTVRVHSGDNPREYTSSTAADTGEEKARGRKPECPERVTRTSVRVPYRVTASDRVQYATVVSARPRLVRASPRGLSALFIFSRVFSRRLSGNLDASSYWRRRRGQRLFLLLVPYRTFPLNQTLYSRTRTVL